ncbi:MAG: prepilin peptidase [Pseudomonadota bacterium]
MSPALAFLIFATPICLWAAYSDMRYMKIRNQAVAALLLVYAVVGFFVLPLEDYLWRYTHFVVVLVVGFVLSQVRAIGAGDAKFAASMAPFIALQNAVTFIYLFAALIIVSFVLHRVLRRLPMVKRMAPDWVSWTHNKFPMGLALGPSLIIYLALAVRNGFVP